MVHEIMLIDLAVFSVLKMHQEFQARRSLAHEDLSFQRAASMDPCIPQSVVLDISLSIFRFFSSPEKSAEGGMHVVRKNAQRDHLLLLSQVF